jgi:hypothetical protein
VAAIAVVVMDAAHGDTYEPFEIGDDGTERVAIIWNSLQSLACARTAHLWARWRAWQLTPCSRTYVARLCPAAADALHLGRVQRVGLRSALALLLVAELRREIEQQAKAALASAIALDLAADIRMMRLSRGAGIEKTSISSVGHRPKSVS